MKKKKTAVTVDADDEDAAAVADLTAGETVVETVASVVGVVDVDVEYDDDDGIVRRPEWRKSWRWKRTSFGVLLRPLAASSVSL